MGTDKIDTNLHFKIDRKKLSDSISDAFSESLNCDEESFREHSRRGETLAQLKNFGVGMLNIQEAAELIACDMWASGEIEIEELESFDGHILAPEVKAALPDVVTLFVNRLTKAIEAGTLRPEWVRRDFDENLIASETYIALEPLEEWLFERGYTFGEAFTEWQDGEMEIADRLVDEVIWLRAAKGKIRGQWLSVGFTSFSKSVDDFSQAELVAAYKSAVLENEHLRERLAKAESNTSSVSEPSVSPRRRRTLLTLIAALMELLKEPVEKPRPRGMNQEAIKATIMERFPVRGLGDRSLEEIFADANRARADAE